MLLSRRGRPGKRELKLTLVPPCSFPPNTTDPNPSQPCPSDQHSPLSGCPRRRSRRHHGRSRPRQRSGRWTLMSMCVPSSRSTLPVGPAGLTVLLPVSSCSPGLATVQEDDCRGSFQLPVRARDHGHRVASARLGGLVDGVRHPLGRQPGRRQARRRIRGDHKSQLGRKGGNGEHTHIRA